MVDRLLASQHIVLARPDTKNPFRFEAVSALEGPLTAVELPHLVDSNTRRRFQANPDARVLFAREGADGRWHRVIYVDEAMQEVLSFVMPRLRDWENGDDIERSRYFGTLVESTDSRVRRLALRELDQVNYAMLRSLDLDPEPDFLAERLNILNEADLAPIRILLLGFANAPNVGSLLRNGVDRNKMSGTNPRLGAYATAWVEYAGSDAIDALTSNYLSNKNLPIDSREMIVEALAIHAEARDNVFDDEVSLALASALQIDPRLAPAVARQFGSRWQWSMRDALSSTLRANKLTAITDILVVSQYLASAEQAELSSAN